VLDIDFGQAEGEHQHDWRQQDELHRRDTAPVAAEAAEKNCDAMSPQACS
jgi:hypothetical protein